MTILTLFLPYHEWGQVFKSMNPTGAAGNLKIIAGELLVTDGATVAVNSLGTGNAGALTAIAREINRLRLEAVGRAREALQADV